VGLPEKWGCVPRFQVKKFTPSRIIFYDSVAALLPPTLLVIKRQHRHDKEDAILQGGC
jgi:hypothetical protein